MKKAFILYNDSLEILNDLTDEEAGQLFKLIAAYNSEKDIKTDKSIRMLFLPFKNQFIRDLEKYEKKSETNRANGSKGGKRSQTKSSVRKRLEANQADSDKDSDKDKDKDKESVSGISENDLNLIHAHTSIFRKTVENEIWVDDMASTLNTSSLNIKKYTEQKFKEWKISGTLTKYSLGTLIGWLIKDFQQQHGRVITDYDKEETKRRNSNSEPGETDRLFGKS